MAYLHPPKIIAFCGYKGSGKDTCAIQLHDLLRKVPLQGKQHNLATPVKELCQYMFGLEYAEMNSPTLKEKVLERWPHESPRRLMQKFATEGVRTLWPDVWVEHWKRTYDSFGKRYAYVFLTDLRFPNEYNYFRSKNAYIIRVNRPELEQTDKHESELHQATFEVDYEVNNDSTMATLAARVAQLLYPRVLEAIRAPS